MRTNDGSQVIVEVRAGTDVIGLPIMDGVYGIIYGSFMEGLRTAYLRLMASKIIILHCVINVVYELFKFSPNQWVI